jgi:hypothetical protein
MTFLRKWIWGICLSANKVQLYWCALLPPPFWHWKMCANSRYLNSTFFCEIYCILIWIIRDVKMWHFFEAQKFNHSGHGSVLNKLWLALAPSFLFHSCISHTTQYFSLSRVIFIDQWLEIIFCKVTSVFATYDHDHCQFHPHDSLKIPPIINHVQIKMLIEVCRKTINRHGHRMEGRLNLLKNAQFSRVETPSRKKWSIKNYYPWLTFRIGTNYAKYLHGRFSLWAIYLCTTIVREERESIVSFIETKHDNCSDARRYYFLKQLSSFLCAHVTRKKTTILLILINCNPGRLNQFAAKINLLIDIDG